MCGAHVSFGSMFRLLDYLLYIMQRVVGQTQPDLYIRKIPQSEAL